MNNSAVNANVTAKKLNNLGRARKMIKKRIKKNAAGGDDGAGGKPRGKHSRKGLLSALIVLAVIACLLFALSGFITDWMWFTELGYQRVFWTELKTKVLMGIPVFLLAVLLVKVYLSSLKKGYFRKVESSEIPDERKLKLISWGLSGIFGLIFSVLAANGCWMTFLQYANSTDFDLTDPMFNLDISFYIFKLTFLSQANSLALSLIIGVIVITLAYYAVLLTVRTPDIFDYDEDDFDDNAAEAADAASVNDDEEAVPFEGAKSSRFGGLFDLFKPMFGSDGNVKNVKNVKRKGTSHRNHNGSRTLDRQNIRNLLDIAKGKATVLGIVFYIMLATTFLFRQFELLQAHTGTVYGAGYTDVHITLWVYRIAMALCAVGIITLCVYMKKGEYLKLARVPIAMVLVVLVGYGTGFAVQKLFVTPDEINKETTYLERTISYTRTAYGIDDVVTEEFPADNSLTSEDIVDNQQTITNIRINDYEPVQDYYNQTQSIRQYYEFNDADIDRYVIDGEITQTYLSSREINESNISDTWINKHLKYTHGYGAAVSRVDAVTSSGQPDIIVQDIPPSTQIEELLINRPEIYFGEMTDDYVIVNTKESEFDYPNGDENEYTTYEGEVGIKLNLFNRILFAIRERSLNVLVSSNITSDSQIIINRNIMDRVEKIMPYLSYESDPYMTIVDGELFWIIDAYTSSDLYPYSEPYSDETDTNYIRNSVKVVVNAYSGDVDYYIVDEEDPIALTYQKIFPTLFKDFDEMPEGIKEHIRYPNTLFKIQAEVYTKYHMTSVKVFYQGEDLWDIANQIYGTEEVEMEPSYYVLELPDSDTAEFVNMIPFTPKSKQNMTAIMVARNDGEHYGELVAYTMPKNKTVYGPMQVEAQIDQNTEISKEFSLWNSSGSTYKRGDLFVIPIEGSIVYVEPVYLEASNQAIPEVKRVIVMYNGRIAYKSTLSEALEELFGEGYTSQTTSEGTGDTGETSSDSLSQAELIAGAYEAYQNAVEAQESGDWAAYGEYLEELEDYLNQLQDS